MILIFSLEGKIIKNQLLFTYKGVVKIKDVVRQVKEDEKRLGGSLRMA